MTIFGFLEIEIMWDIHPDQCLLYQFNVLSVTKKSTNTLVEILRPNPTQIKQININPNTKPVEIQSTKTPHTIKI